MRALLVENDIRVVRPVVFALAKHGVATRWVSRGKDALSCYPDVQAVVLELGLPDVDGIEVCRTIRSASDIAIIVATARSGMDERILALNAGADDYLVKPYDVNELVARVGAVLRRRRPGDSPPSGPIRVGVLEIDPASRAVTVAGRTIPVSHRECQILALIAQERGAACPRRRIIAKVWGRDWRGANRALDFHISVLRSKLGRPDMIETVRGYGYRLNCRPEKHPPPGADHAWLAPIAN